MSVQDPQDRVKRGADVSQPCRVPGTLLSVQACLLPGPAKVGDNETAEGIHGPDDKSRTHTLIFALPHETVFSLAALLNPRLP